jgi:hypothetical protein
VDQRSLGGPDFIAARARWQRHQFAGLGKLTRCRAFSETTEVVVDLLNAGVEHPSVLLSSAALTPLRRDAVSQHGAGAGKCFTLIVGALGQGLAWPRATEAFDPDRPTPAFNRLRKNARTLSFRSAGFAREPGI